LFLKVFAAAKVRKMTGFAGIILRLVLFPNPVCLNPVKTLPLRYAVEHYFKACLKPGNIGRASVFTF
jgi:hypothetical protein